MMKSSKNELVRSYNNFMFDEANIMNCENCPENMGCNSFQHRLPCGQWHCWIQLYTNYKELDNEEFFEED